jgi:flagellar biosynthesis/type III secretory pathway M-ring protein FliF/YscJ
MKNKNKGLLNLLIGIILVIVGVAWYFVRIPYLSTYVRLIDFYPFYEILVLFIVGIFGVCIFFAGLVLAWMGWDDYKMSKDLEDTEEEYEEDVEFEDEDEFEAEEEFEEEDEEEEESSPKEKELEAELRKEMKSTSEIVCEVCGKVVKSKAGLSAHMRTHK